MSQDLDHQALEEKCAHYEKALQDISAITKFEVPLEGASAFLFGICSKMRKIAKVALESPVISDRGRYIGLEAPCIIVDDPASPEDSMMHMAGKAGNRL